MVTLANVAVRMTVDEFLQWDHPGPLRYELVDGEPRTIPLGPLMHGFVHAELGAVIGNHLDAHDPSCRVLGNAGIIPGRRPHDNFRVADLAVSREPMRPDVFALAEPLLIAEILAPDDAARTWANVAAYMSIPSVREILVVHSDRVAADVLRRGEDGTWPDAATPVTGDTMELASIGFRVALSDLYAHTGLAG